MKPESQGTSLTKLILVVSLLVSFGSILGAAGYLVNNKQIMISQPQVLSTPEPTVTAAPIIKDETADWKTYRNEEYGFEFKYPKNLKLTEKEGVVILFSTSFVCSVEGVKEKKEVNDIKIIFNQKSGLSYAQTWKDVFGFDFNKDAYEGSEIIGGKTAYFYSMTAEMAMPFRTYLIEQAPTKAIEIKRYVLVRTMVDNCIPEMEGDVDYLIGIETSKNILSTFKFIDKDSFFSCGTSTVNDVDNNTYNTVKIGEQCWLKENLKVTKNPAGEPITRYCYDNNPKICDTDGGLYDWNTAMNNSTTEGAQGICPNGWHIPKDSEWYVLENYLKDEGRTCISTRGGMWNSIKNGGWDCNSAGTKLKMGGSSGFDGILAGYRDVSGELYYQTSYAYFWSSTQSGLNAWGRFLNLGLPQVLRNRYNKNTNFSVRCLKD